VIWSTCNACAQIAIWEQGFLVYPPRATGAPTYVRLPIAAKASLLVAAHREREGAAEDLEEARGKLAVLEQHGYAVMRFLARFVQYDDVLGGGGPGRRLHVIS
jgi:hypothetical protein